MRHKLNTKLIILGISDSIESHACVFKDGKLLSFISEERLSRIKADAGYPKLSIEKVLVVSSEAILYLKKYVPNESFFEK